MSLSTIENLMYLHIWLQTYQFLNLSVKDLRFHKTQSHVAKFVILWYVL